MQNQTITSEKALAAAESELDQDLIRAEFPGDPNCLYPGLGMRISCHIYTTKAEIDKLLDALSTLVK
jgi:selenocysteine lyase/cysteine desulfurase